MYKKMGLAVLIVLVLLLVPFVYIWSLNTLFPSLNIAYGFDTWLAVIIVHTFFHQTISIKK
jgi:hypothetical protein